MIQNIIRRKNTYVLFVVALLSYVILVYMLKGQDRQIEVKESKQFTGKINVSGHGDNIVPRNVRGPKKIQISVKTTTFHYDEYDDYDDNIEEDLKNKHVQKTTTTRSIISKTVKGLKKKKLPVKTTISDYEEDDDYDDDTEEDLKEKHAQKITTIRSFISKNVKRLEKKKLPVKTTISDYKEYDDYDDYDDNTEEDIKKNVPKTTTIRSMISTTVKGLKKKKLPVKASVSDYDKDMSIENIENLHFTGMNNISGYPYYVVPNIVHLIHFGKPKINFDEMILIKTSHVNQKPDRIIIHCNCSSISGKYWDMVKDISELEVKFKKTPKRIFGKKFGNIQHASDIARIEVLMEYGGIYMDTDVYVVSSLDKYRKFEFAIGWSPGQVLGNQVLVAHKNARFLKLWYESYRNYHPKLWYFNAGEYPTTSILYKTPYLVHRVPRDFGVDMLVNMLYVQRSEKWKTYTTIHLLLRHKGYLVKDDPVKEFDEENIKSYNRTYGDMVRLILFGSTDLIS